MRFVLVMLAALTLWAQAAPAMAFDGGSALVAQQAQPSQPSGKIDIDITSERGGAWYANPLWIAIGVIALVVIVLLIVMASRGGGTTIVKE